VKKDNSQGGFTLMETLVAMTVVSLIMIILSLALSSSAGAMEGAKNRALFGIGLLRTDSLIRDRIGAVAVPYWERAEAKIDGSSAMIPWYRGEREGYVRIAVEEGTLVMETWDKQKKERITLLSDLDGADFSLLRNGENDTYGVGVACLRGQNSYHILSAFSTFPLTGEFPLAGGSPFPGGRP
jgi:prepilin-type N-terminal cleavage/methylation domain-containing protein